MRERVAEVRAFSRFLTQRVGALNEAFLGRPRSLGASRLLWELGDGPVEIRALRQRLGLDSGYLSRLLRGLEADGLAVTEAGREDTRVRSVRLTSAGAAERAELDRLSDAAAASILEPLSEEERGKLVSAMAEVRRLVLSSAIDIRVARPAEPDARYCIANYFAELDARFDTGFDPGRSIPASDAELIEPHGVLLVATLHGEPVGCGALKFRSGGAADVKRMWVSPHVRGLGLGRRILLELESQARARGVARLHLETNRALTEAVSMYRSSGYREVPAFSSERYADHWFAKDLDPSPHAGTAEGRSAAPDRKPSRRNAPVD